MRTVSSRWLCLTWAARSTMRWIVGSSVVGRRNMFLRRWAGRRPHAHCATSLWPRHGAIPQQRLGAHRACGRRAAAMRRSSRSLLVLARIEATPPQRVMGCIDWTPSETSSPIIGQYALDQPSRLVARLPCLSTCRPMLEILTNRPSSYQHVASRRTLQFIRYLSVG
jgi:hypothetical protein